MKHKQNETILRVLYFVPCLSFAALLFVNSYSHTSDGVTMLVNVMRKWLIQSQGFIMLNLDLMPRFDVNYFLFLLFFI